MNNLDHILAGIVQKWGDEQLKSKNILNYNGANLAYIHGRDVAQKLGVDEENIMPYPSRVTIMNEDKPKSYVLPLILASAIGAGSLGAVGTYLLTRDAPSPPDTGELLYEVE